MQYRGPAAMDLPLPAQLRADCAACAALCCAGPAFDAAQGFGYDKPAHQPCRHLAPSHACTIHAQRRALGFGACEVFDCHGAGQRATALFAGASWQDGPAVAVRMFEAYARLRVLHELLVLLAAAGRRAPDAAVARALAALAQRVEAACAGPLEAFERRGDPQPLRQEVLQALRQWGARLFPAPAPADPLTPPSRPTP